MTVPLSNMITPGHINDHNGRGFRHQHTMIVFQKIILIELIELMINY